MLKVGSTVKEVKLGKITLKIDNLQNLSLDKHRYRSEFKLLGDRQSIFVFRRGDSTFAPFRLTDAKYQCAVAGLIQSMVKPWSLDIRGHNFDEGNLQSSLRGSSSLQSLNALTLSENSGQNLSRALRRDR